MRWNLYLQFYGNPSDGIHSTKKFRMLSLMKRMLLMDVYVQDMQERRQEKRREEKRKERRELYSSYIHGLSTHVSKIFKGLEKFDSESLHSTFKCTA